MFLRYLYDRFSLSIHLWLNTDWFHLLDIVNSGGIYPRVYKGFSFPHRWQYLWPFAFLVMAILTCLRWHITIVLIRYCDTSSLFFLPEFVLALFMSGYWSGVCFSFICSELHLVLLQLFFSYSAHTWLQMGVRTVHQWDLRSVEVRSHQLCDLLREVASFHNCRRPLSLLPNRQFVGLLERCQEVMLPGFR